MLLLLKLLCCWCKQVVWSCHRRRWRCLVLHPVSRQVLSELQVLQWSRTPVMRYRHGRTRLIRAGRPAAVDCRTLTATAPCRPSLGRQLELVPRRTCHRRHRHEDRTGRRGILHLVAKIASWELAATNLPAPCEVSLIVMRANCDYVSLFMVLTHVHINGYIVDSVRLRDIMR